jgi:cytochrome P450 family 144
MNRDLDSSPVVLFDEAVLASPYEAYRRLGAEGAVHYEPSLDLFFVLDDRTIHEVLDDPTTYSSNLMAVLQRDGAGVTMPGAGVSKGLDVLAIADPPSHTAHRRLVQPTLSKRAVQNLRGAIDHEMVRRIEELVALGGGDWMVAVATPVPVVIISQILDLPAEDAGRLLGWSDASVELLSGVAGPDRMIAIAAAIAEFMAYLGERLAGESDGLIGDIRAEIGRQLSHDEAVSLLLQLVTAGTESTTSLLGSAVRRLAGDAELQDRLRADPGLLDNFVEEILRLESPFRGHFRVATTPARLGDRTIPEGGRLMLLWGSANRDPSRYAEPDRLDLARPTTGGHLAFGHGIHFCVGAHLARLEARLGLERLLELSDEVRLSADHVDVYRPSLLVRRLERVDIEVTSSR